MSDNSALLAGAAIALFSVATAGVIAEVRDWWKERKTAHRVASALCAEIVALADVVATCGSLANFAEFGLKGDDLNTPFLASVQPPEFTAYRSLASQLPLLDIATVSAVVAFYGSVDWARRISTQHSAEKTVPTGHLPILGNQWRAAAKCALIAYDRIGKHVPLSNAKDESDLAELVAELGEVVNKKWPRIHRDEAKGALKIGRASRALKDAGR